MSEGGEGERKMALLETSLSKMLCIRENRDFRRKPNILMLIHIDCCQKQIPMF